MFTSLHAMFDTQYNELWDSLDEIAERIRALGLPAPFGDSTLTKLASIEEASSIPPAMDMVKQLMSDHEAVARTARSVFEIADAANDQPSADLLTQRLQVHEKTAWMLRSVLQN